MEGKIFISLILLLCLLSTVSATHFRFGTISYKIPDASKPREVEFYSSFTFRRSFFGTPNVGSKINPGSFNFGDGTKTVPIELLITVVNLESDWVSGTFSYKKNYTKDGVFTAYHSSAGRILELNNNRNQNWRVSCQVSIGSAYNVNGVPNTAPVSNNLPIVTVYYGEVNTFYINAIDAEKQEIKYSFATATEMGGSKLVLIDNSNIAIDEKTGLVTFTATNINKGFWCTQIKFSDASSFGVVDFLINIVDRPKACVSRCSTNAGKTCTAHTQCGTCTGVPNDQRCMEIEAPYLVQPPTPADNEQFTVDVAKTLTIYWSAYSASASTVLVTTSSLPSTAKLVTTVSGSRHNQTFTWTPTMDEVGGYVITLGCEDNKGQSCTGQVAFSINVVRPPCGNGGVPVPSSCTGSSCACNCPSTGFDANCYNCKKGFFGPNCKPCPACDQGVCSDGISGIGGCICDVGYQGADCSYPGNALCNNTAGNSIVTTIPSAASVSPATTYVYLSRNSQTLDLSINTKLVTNPSKLDVLLLIDVTKSMSETPFSFQASYSKPFFDSVRSRVPNSYFGVASFTDRPQASGCSSSDYPFKLHLPLSDDYNDLSSALTNYIKATSLGCNDNTNKKDSQLDALILSTAAGVGWRSDAYKIVLVVTDSSFFDGYANGYAYNTREETKKALVAANIIPIFLVDSNSVKSDYDDLVNSFQFGATTTVSSKFRNVLTQAANQMTEVVKDLTVSVTDDYGVIQSVRDYRTTGLRTPITKETKVGLNYNSKLDSIESYPQLVVTMMGWGTSTIVTQVNRPPISAVCAATTREDIGVDVSISGSDADGNALLIYMLSLPSHGTLTVSKSSDQLVLANGVYRIPDGTAYPFFHYTPSLHYDGSDSFQYRINDGCSNSSDIVTCRLTITDYNYPPTATSSTISTDENQPIDVKMLGEDVETEDKYLVFFVTSLPDSSLGVLKRKSGEPVVIKQQLNPGEDTLRFEPVQYACCDFASFSFQVQDKEGQTSVVPGTIDIDIIGINQNPTVSASDITVVRGSVTPITFSAWDPDYEDLITFVVTSASPGFTYGSTNASIPTSTSLKLAVGNQTVNGNGNAGVTIYYKAPTNQAGANFAKIIFYAYDEDKAESSKKTVFVSVSTINTPPTANPAGPITLFQDSSSGEYSLNGTDIDAADAKNLTVRLDSLPTRGTLTQVGYGDIPTGTLPFLLTNGKVVYRTNSTGADSFAFRVVDLMGATSAQQVVRIEITAVNHAPTASFPQVSTPEDTPITLQVSPYDQDGDRLTVILTSLTRGSFWQFDNTPITKFPTALTDLQFRFKFQGAKDEFGDSANNYVYTSFTFYVNDNQNKPNSNSTVVTGSIIVTPVNDPPVAIPIVLSIKENSGPVDFILNATDVETPESVSAFLITKPLASLGTIKTVSNTNLEVRTNVPSPRKVTFHPNSYQYGTTTFTFGANDGSVDSESSATATIIVEHVNHAPMASATSPVTATRSVPFTITLTVRDYDIGDNLTVTISSFTGKGVLSYNNVAITAPYELPAVTIPASNSRTITLSYLAPATATGSNFDSFSFDVVDQDKLGAGATNVVIAIANNNPPVANPAGPHPTKQDYMSNSLPLNGTDIDVADAQSLVVVVVTPPTKGDLYYKQGNDNIKISANTVLPNGVSAVSYLTYQRGSDSFTFAVRDLLGAVSSPVLVSIPISNTNHPPSAFWTGTASGREDTMLDITNIQASDPDGDTLTVTILAGPEKGTLYQFDGVTVCNAPCNVTDSRFRLKFLPAADENSKDNQAYATITFAATDKVVYSDSKSGAIFIAPVNDAPVAYSSTVTTEENKNIDITLNATDIDTPMVQVAVIIQSVPSATYGVIRSLAGVTLQVGSVLRGDAEKKLTFVPTQYANGVTTFSFSLNDGELSSATATVTVEITPVHQTPVCSVSPSAFSDVARDSSTSHVLNVFDPDQGETYTFSMTSFEYLNGGKLYIKATNQLVSASTTVIASDVTTKNFYGGVELKYDVLAEEHSTFARLGFRVFDGTDYSDVCYLQLNSSDNKPPSATPVNLTIIDEDTATGLILLNGTDVDNYDSLLTVLITALPQNGVLQQDSPRKVIDTRSELTYGSFYVIYTPKKLWHGNDTFSFVVKDIAGAISNTVVVTIQVDHVNHAPRIVAGNTVTTDEDTPVLITQIIASDDDGDEVFVYLQHPPANGHFEQANGDRIPDNAVYPVKIESLLYNFRFVPAENENGSPYAKFTVYAQDKEGLRSDPEEVDINVTPVDDPPIAVNVHVTGPEQETSLSAGISFSLNATDVDTDLSNISATILSLPSASKGALKYNGEAVSVGTVIPLLHKLEFVPLAYTFGTTQFSFNVKDATSYSANSATVFIEVTHVNHDPTATEATVTAVRGIPLTISLAGTDPDADDVFHFVLDAVTPGTDGVFARSNGDVLDTPNTNISTDIKNTQSRTFSTSITYTAPATASGNGFATVSYHIVDQMSGESDSKTITIDIAPNSAPIAVPASFVADQDTPSPYEVLYGTDADPADANTLILVITTLPRLGVLIVNSTLNITAENTVLPSGTNVSYYTTRRGSDSFTYYVEDNLGEKSGTVIAYITINNVNHPPTAVYHGPASGIEDHNVTINQIALSDPDGDFVRVYVTAIPESGTLTQYDGTPITSASKLAPVLVEESHGWLIYVPEADKFGDPLASFTFYADDGQGEDNSRTEYINGNITVTPVNDAPISLDGTTTADENSEDILITLDVYDVDTDLANISVKLASLPASSIGLLVDPVSKVPIKLLQNIPSRQVLLQLVAYSHGETSFSFFANDGELDSVTAGTQTIIIANVNQAPTASAASPVNVHRTVPSTITLQVFDIDYPEYFDISVVSYSTRGGYFSYDEKSFEDISATTPFKIASNVTKSPSGNKILIQFTAPADMFGEDFASISLQVADAAGSTSELTNVTVNVLQGTRPVATPAGPIEFNEESTSYSFSLNGTDVDPADEDNLSIRIVSLPSKATLYVVSTDGTPDVAINQSGVVLKNPTVYLVGATLTYGKDSFTFAVVDAVNQASTTSTVEINIIHVNHPPVAGAIITTGFMNSPLTFQVFGQDPDNDQPITVSVTALPTVGYLFQADGTPITDVTEPVRVTDFNGKLIYQAPTNEWGEPITNISIVADDSTNTTNSQSEIFIISISMKRVDLPPTVGNYNLSMLQNGEINFTIVAEDIQHYSTYITIITFPIYGTLYRANGSEINPSNPITRDGFVRYVPPLKAHDDGIEPYATITFRATANSTLSSNIGTGVIYVNQTVGAPIYTGQLVYDIPENTNLSMLLTGSSETGNYNIRIISVVAADRGVLFTRSCMGGDEGCMEYYFADGEDMDSTTMEYRLRYAPPLDKYGNGFANFTIIITDDFGASDPVTITINVYHINVPPVIVPWTYDTLDEHGVTQTYNWSNAIINIIEGNDAVISWKLADKDTPQVNLTSIVYGLPYRGSLFYVQETTDGYTAGEPLTTAGVVLRANPDGLFRLVYRPLPGKSGNNYATCSLIGFDEIDQSARIALKINVRHINQAPWVVVQQPNWNATSGSPVIITGVSVNDTDGSYFNELFELSLSKSDGSPAPQGSLLELLFFSNSSCKQQSDVKLNCTATLTNLNQLLNQISVTVPQSGEYTITVFVNDLGAGSSDRSINHLNGTGYVYVSATVSAGTTVSEPSSNSVMTAVVASVAGVGAAAAAGVWTYMKKKSPPTIDFFGMESVTTQVTNNPLFEDATTMSFTNALYEMDN